jgi:serine/threonine protein kinase
MEWEASRFGPEVIAEALSDCEILELIGIGRFGETYRAARGDDVFALKICHFLPCMPPALWEREIAALERVSHPNVMRFRHAGHVRLSGRICPYMECEYIPGGDLGQRLANGALPHTASELRAFFVGLLRGTKELHDLGILHRDIRPSNIVPRNGDWAQPVLLDFGLAQACNVSPAQQRLSIASRRVDLVDVAAVVYEAGTGRSPRGPVAAERTAESPDGSKPRRATDPRKLAATFDDDLAELVVDLLAGKRRRMGADEALRALGAE